MRLGIRKAVMAVLVNAENKVLIGSSPRDGGYKFPQGGLEPDEDIIEGLKRELIEELALTIFDDDIVEVYATKVSYPYPNDGYYIYDAQELSIVKVKYHTKMTIIPQDDEFENLLWVNAEELPNFDFQFRLEAYQNALRICKLL